MMKFKNSHYNIPKTNIQEILILHLLIMAVPAIILKLHLTTVTLLMKKVTLYNSTVYIKSVSFDKEIDEINKESSNAK